ncbi:MAG TPA: MFS transporter [Anaerolineales bacterium]|nr:MFS transporter [Anaerolineales bacterium]
MPQTLTMTNEKIPVWKKFIFGSGDWSIASFVTLRQIYYAIFLTDVVGLDARLASFAALISIIWDAINDPLVGMISDRLKTRWGRRRPFLLWFALPYGLGFLLLWWAPPWENQIALAITVSLTYMISDTLQTFIFVPLYALTPEITLDYDERTSLTGFRMFFNLLASLITAVAAPAIIDAALTSGATQQQGYLLVAALFGGLAIVPLLLIFFFIKERKRTEKEIELEEKTPLKEILHTVWQNIPFRFATGIYVFNWLTFDIVALMLPFYLAYWIAEGDLLYKALGMPLESTVFAFLLGTSVFALPLWVWMAKKFGKRHAYIIGMSFWTVVLMIIFSIKPGQINTMLILSVLAGLSVATAHVLPDSIFPDIIEWDELRTGRRQEGIYYGIKNFIRKLTGAVAIFFSLQVIGWFGYQSPPEGVTQFTQSDSALIALRILIGPVGALLLTSAMVMAWLYPLTREKHTRILRLLEKKKAREK